MANRRMFSKAIIRSPRFKRMSSDAKLLYIDLGMEADDEGFVQAWIVANGNLEGYEELVDKKFVEQLDEDFLTLILDWNENNQISASKMTKSVYREGYENRTVDTNFQNSCETPAKVLQKGYETSAKVLQKGYETPAKVLQNSCDSEEQNRLGKDRLDKVSTDKVSKDISSSSKIEQEFESLWELYPRKQGKKKALEAYKRAVKAGATYEAVKTGIDGYTTLIQCTNIQPEYIKHGSTWFGNACWEDDYKIPANTGNASIGKKVKSIPNWADETKTEQSEISPEEKARRDAEFEKLRQQALEAGM